MPPNDDIALLRRFATENSEEAFATLVARYIGLVHSVAMRQTGNPHAAEEITQGVFIILARKAGSLGSKVVLAGWLYQTARLAAANYLRTEIRRARREQEAYMDSLLNETDSANSEAWQRISPLLEAAMGGLSDADRNAIVLRYFENKGMGEIAAALNASEATVRKRVTRAVERLRKFFAQRGVTLSATAIVGIVSANSVQAAPIGLAATVSATVVKGSAVAASTLTLVKGTMKIMTWLKLKTAAAIGATVILATGTTIVASKVIAQQSSDGVSPVDDSAWARIDTKSLNDLPPAFVLRPTHFANGRGGIGGGMATTGNKMLGRAILFDALMSLAYDVDMVQVVSPPDAPKGGFDLLMTDPDASRNRLQEEIKRKFGYVAHRETRQVDVLLLTLKNADAPGLKPSQGQSKGRGFASSSSSSAGAGAGVRSRTVASQNQPISNLIKNLQGHFDKPIIDRTDLLGNFDISLEITTGNGDSESDAIMRTLPAQLGLELVPSREPVEMLVVEKVK